MDKEPIYFATIEKSSRPKEHIKIYGVYRGYLYFANIFGLQRRNFNGITQIITSYRPYSKVIFAGDRIYVGGEHTIDIFYAASGAIDCSYHWKGHILGIFAYENTINAIMKDKIVILLKNNKPTNVKMQMRCVIKEWAYLVFEVCNHKLYVYDGEYLRAFNLVSRTLIGIVSSREHITKMIDAGNQLWIATNARMISIDSDCRFDDIKWLIIGIGQLKKSKFYQEIVCKYPSISYENGQMYCLRNNSMLIIWRTEPTLEILYQQSFPPSSDIKIAGGIIYAIDNNNMVTRHYFAPIFTNLRREFARIDLVKKRHILFSIWIFRKFAIPLDIIEKIILATV